MTSEAFSLIVEMLRRSDSSVSSFPPTELFSEGWMLRLMMESASRGLGGLPFGFHEGARWYSEARLASAFAHRDRRDPFAETSTHPDGVIGHFGFRKGTKAGLFLEDSATQFMVLEAKMNSPLSGTSKVEWFDQAARNVAALAWTVHNAGLEVSQLGSVGFHVVAPAHRIAKEATFAEYTSLESVREKVLRRIDLYTDDTEVSQCSVTRRSCRCSLDSTFRWCPGRTCSNQWRPICNQRCGTSTPTICASTDDAKRHRSEGDESPQQVHIPARPPRSLAISMSAAWVHRVMRQSHDRDKASSTHMASRLQRPLQGWRPLTCQWPEASCHHRPYDPRSRAGYRNPGQPGRFL